MPEFDASMKKLLVFGSFLLFTLALSAQNDYFLFIQSENNQPYYVQTDGKTLSSSAIGHLIISGLKDSVYSLNIGFPKNQFPEQVFQVRINKKDGGYQLKNMGTDGWVLFNIQTLQLIKAQPAALKKQTISYGDIRKSDVFSTLMAGLVNDSAVLYTSIAKVEPVKESSKASVSDTQPLPNEVTRTDAVAKKDSVTRPLEAVVQETPKQIDSAALKTEVVQKIEPPKKDTTLANKDVAIKEIKDQAPKADTTAIKAELAKSTETSQKDSALKTGIDSVRAEAPAVVRPPVKDSLAFVDKKVIPDTASQGSISIGPEKKPDVKPLIVWFSETKTSMGTELVYYDMSSPDAIDTIRIFIQKEEGVVETPARRQGSDTANNQPEPAKKGNGTFLGRVFGKKNRKDPVDGTSVSATKPKESAKESSISVTTVEDRKPVSQPKDKPDTMNSVKAKVTPETNASESETKSRSGNFLGKLFGKKNNAKATDDDTNTAKAKESSITVTTVEEKKPEKKVPPEPQNNASATVEGTPASTATQPDKERRSGNFLGRLFGKKKSGENSTSDSTIEDGAKRSTIKVTTVEKNRTSDSVIIQKKPSTDQTGAEVEKLRRDQEREEKTTAQRFVGKLFGKKNKKTDKVSELPANSVKVTTVEKTQTEIPQTNKPVITNSDCRDLASEYDVDKLRVRMLGEKDADGQVTEARKTFKSKCFSTTQIKSLSTLFRTDEGKYKLFDAAYPFVSDSNNFKDLISLLSDEYYINRFKAMVRM